MTLQISGAVAFLLLLVPGPPSVLVSARHGAPDGAQVEDPRRREAAALFSEAAKLEAQGPRFAPEAIATYERALMIWQAVGDRREVARTRHRLGAAHIPLDDYESAVEQYSNALALWRALGDRRGEATTLASMGRAYEFAGDYKKAKQALVQALPLHQSEPDRLDEPNVLRLLGLVSYRLGQFDAAIAFLDQALPLHQARGESHNAALDLTVRGWALHSLGRNQAALESYERALPFARAAGARGDPGLTLHAIGSVHATLGDHAKAVAFYQEALTLRQAFGVLRVGINTLYALSQSEQALGHLTDARRHVEQALDLFEPLRSRFSNDELRSLYFASHRKYFDSYIGVLMALHEASPAAGHDREAFDASERARARSLLDLLVESGIARTHDDGFAQILPFESVRTLLDASTALLQYSVAGPRSFLFVVTRDGLHTYQLPGADDLNALVRDLRSTLDRPGRRVSAFARAARRLYDRLIAPAAGALEGKTRLLVAPDAGLSLVPFEVLLTDEPAGPIDGRVLPYLIKRWAVGYIPSASVLAAVRARAATNRESPVPGPAFLGIADPIGLSRAVAPAATLTAAPSDRASSRARFVPLPNARREVSDIAKRFAPRETVVLMGTEAAEDRVRRNAALTSARRVHFATHAIIDDVDPTQSGLVLAPSNHSDHDGLLRVPEIFNLRLSADLVVLSACATGLGPQLRGEGIIGLTRAFLYAGTSSVAVSLWPVADRSTADLMVGFYDRMGGLDKLDALRRAKLAMIERSPWAHPYYWAPFVLVGEPR